MPTTFEADWDSVEGEAESIAKARLELDGMCLQSECARKQCAEWKDVVSKSWIFMDAQTESVKENDVWTTIEELASQKTLQMRIPLDTIGEVCGHQRSTINEIER